MLLLSQISAHGDTGAEVARRSLSSMRPAELDCGRWRLMGVARGLRRARSDARIVALEPDTSPALTAGHGGKHRVEGIAVERGPGDYDGTWRSGIGVPANSRWHGRLMSRAQRIDVERRALSVEMPVFAYICR
jgi:hypothetical protein